MSITKLIAASLLFVTACPNTAPAGDDAPTTPAECRQGVLKEIQRIRKMKGPEHTGPGDEHIARSIARRFHDLKSETTLILAAAGDKNALKTILRELALEQEDEDRWIEGKQSRWYNVYPFWTNRILAVVEVLEAQQPEFAKKTRERMMRLAKHKAPGAAGETPHFDRMSLKELREAALAGQGEAMLRWASLDRDDAVPVLIQRLHDKKFSLHEQFLAAQALAVSGEARGLAWLRQQAAKSAASNGATGAGLLRAGEAGRKQFFELVRDYEKKKEEFPPGLANAPLLLDTEQFCELLPQIVEITDKRFRYNLHHAVTLHRLPAATLSYLIEHLHREDLKESFLLDNLYTSLANNGSDDPMARQVAHLWTDELLGAKDTRQWDYGAQLFLMSGLGSKELAAASARRQLVKSTALAAQVLADAGRPEDALLIWAATHGPQKEERWNWYDRPALGWFAVVRLTNHLAPPK